MVTFVATPIGNLGDMSYRAVETLQKADVIFCEDTRHSLRLLNAFGIKKPLFACHKFNEREAAERIIAAASEGKEVAIVSDAGMPVISDPGNVVCAMLKEAGIPYTVAPGANAALSALVLSGLPADRFLFVGFLPDKAGDKRRVLEEYRSVRATLLFHSAPQDVDRDVAAMAEILGDREACAVREITKIHEEAIAFRLKEGLPGEKRGEYVLVVAPPAQAENALSALSEIEHIRYYMNLGCDKKEALKRAARDRGVPKSALYPFAIELKEEE
ncbi:MAG: 16S rRNA (cytidine(1402)-2'-O)-methyltransferase [Christensenellaceae bacterium]